MAGTQSVHQIPASIEHPILHRQQVAKIPNKIHNLDRRPPPHIIPANNRIILTIHNIQTITANRYKQTNKITKLNFLTVSFTIIILCTISIDEVCWL